MSDSLEILEREPGKICVGRLQNLMIVVWADRADATAVACLERAAQRMLALYPNGISGVHLVLDKVGLPTADGRARLVDVLKATAPQLACLGIVVGGTGFWASAMRSFVTGLRFVAPRSYELQMHATTGEVSAWLPRAHAERTGLQLDVTAVQRALESAWTWPAAQDAEALFLPPDPL